MLKRLFGSNGPTEAEKLVGAAQKAIDEMRDLDKGQQQSAQAINLLSKPSLSTRERGVLMAAWGASAHLYQLRSKLPEAESAYCKTVENAIQYYNAVGTSEALRECHDYVFNASVSLLGVLIAQQKMDSFLNLAHATLQKRLEHSRQMPPPVQASMKFDLAEVALTTACCCLLHPNETVASLFAKVSADLFREVAEGNSAICVLAQQRLTRAVSLQRDFENRDAWLAQSSFGNRAGLSAHLGEKLSSHEDPFTTVLGTILSQSTSA